MFLWDSASPGSVVGLSFACSVLSLALLARIGFRFFTPLTALAAVFFLATSASEPGIGRRAWQDAVFGFFSLLLFYFSLELLRDSRRWWPQLGFFVIGAWCILMKQNGLIVYALSALAVFLTILFRGSGCAAKSPLRSFFHRVSRCRRLASGFVRRRCRGHLGRRETLAPICAGSSPLQRKLLRRALVANAVDHLPAQSRYRSPGPA